MRRRTYSDLDRDAMEMDAHLLVTNEKGGEEKN